MSPRRSVRTFVPILVILLGVVFGRGRTAESRVAPAPAGNAPNAAAEKTADSHESSLDLTDVGDARHREQIERVVRSMDDTGRPPEGVAQGGRRGGAKGIFMNAEGRLPREPRGYWVESDVWPRSGPRDAERLIFGRKREVYWTRDHYESFVRLR